MHQSRILAVFCLLPSPHLISIIICPKPLVAFSLSQVRGDKTFQVQLGAVFRICTYFFSKHFNVSFECNTRLLIYRVQVIWRRSYLVCKCTPRVIQAISQSNMLHKNRGWKIIPAIDGRIESFNFLPDGWRSGWSVGQMDNAVVKKLTSHLIHKGVHPKFTNI